MSEPHNFIFLNVQERQNTDRNTLLFNVFDVDKLHFEQTSDSSI